MRYLPAILTLALAPTASAQIGLGVLLMDGNDVVGTATKIPGDASSLNVQHGEIEAQPLLLSQNLFTSVYLDVSIPNLRREWHFHWNWRAPWPNLWLWEYYENDTQLESGWGIGW